MPLIQNGDGYFVYSCSVEFSIESNLDSEIVILEQDEIKLQVKDVNLGPDIVLNEPLVVNLVIKDASNSKIIKKLPIDVIVAEPKCEKLMIIQQKFQL